ncbi:unnamed protein product, partial [Mesorhabditis spiculigera]
MWKRGNFVRRPVDVVDTQGVCKAASSTDRLFRPPPDAKLCTESVPAASPHRAADRSPSSAEMMVNDTSGIDESFCMDRSVVSVLSDSATGSSFTSSYCTTCQTTSCIQYH